MEGNITIMCLPNGTWSDYPNCHGMVVVSGFAKSKYSRSKLKE